MAATYTVYYRTGGYANFRWRRALPVATAEEARVQCAEMHKDGYHAFFAQTAWLDEIGMPDTFEEALKEPVMNAFTHTLISTTAEASMGQSAFGHEQPTATLVYKSPLKPVPAYARVHRQITTQSAAMMLHALAAIELAASPYAKQAAVAHNDGAVWYEICDGANVGALMHLMQKVCAAYNKR